MARSGLSIASFLLAAFSLASEAQEWPSQALVDRLGPQTKEMMRMPILPGVGSLKLSVSSVGVVEEIKSFSTRLRGSEKLNLVVATMKGEVKKPSRLVIGTGEFSAVYTKQYQEGIRYALQSQSRAVAVGDTWSIAGSGSHLDTPLRDAGPLVIKVAWLIPKGVSSLSIRVPTYLGEAEID